MGVQPQGGGRERASAGLSGTTSKYLFLSFCMDLTVLIWQLQGMCLCVCMCESEREQEQNQ